MAVVGRNASQILDLDNFNIGQLLFKLEKDNKILVRKLENFEKKYIQNSYSILFNKTCIKEELLPKYTELRLHDPVAKEQKFTIEYRKELLKYQLKQCEENSTGLSKAIQNVKTAIMGNIRDDALRNAIFQKLNTIKQQEEVKIRQRITKKLNDLYRTTMYLPQKRETFINLSDQELTEDQKQVLSLGIKCQYKDKHRQLDKEVELEILYESLLRLQASNTIFIKPELKHQLKSESTKRRNYDKSKLISKEIMAAAQELKNHDSLIVQKADKSNIFVVMDRSEYKAKLDVILQDEQKFTRITVNPIASLKTKVNKIIKAINEGQQQKIFNPIVGEYKPGYLYGTVKIHKRNNPLRPIIANHYANI